MTQTLVPIAICVVLPIAIVLIGALTKINGDNKRTQIILSAIEAKQNVDVDKLAEMFKKPRQSAREILNRRLLWGCMCSLIGIGLMIVSLFNYLTGVGPVEDPVTVPMLFGAPTLAIGISFLIVYFVSRKYVDSEDDKCRK